MTTHGELIGELIAIAGAAHVLTAPAALAAYTADWRGRYTGAAICVVKPDSTAAVAQIVAACARRAMPVVAQGGNTSLCGAATPPTDGNAVVVSLARLNRIRAIDPANNTITVEAGCVLQAIQEAAAGKQRLFPLSLAAQGSCQIGGNLSTNAGGVQVLRYGNARDLTLGLEVVLPDGQVWNALRGLRKDNTGYDLKQLFLGAEGTLGIITAAVLKLFPLPRAMATAWLAISSPAVAVALLADLQASFGSMLTACELVSEVALRLVRQHQRPTGQDLPSSPWHLLVELSAATDDAGCRDALESFLARAIAIGMVEDAVLAHSASQARCLWSWRENIGEAERREGFSIKHDVALPISRLAEFITRADEALAHAFPGIRQVTFGHLGDGNLHYNQSHVEAGTHQALLAAQRQVNRMVYDLVYELGGSFSAEHGIGQLKRDELLRYKSPVEIALMRAIKQAIDPFGLMNPGKIL